MEVEKNLHHNFNLAHRWNCVLLLDEADVFLAKRNKTDLRRNAVTSVFLRCLEYYRRYPLLNHQPGGEASIRPSSQESI